MNPIVGQKADTETRKEFSPMSDELKKVGVVTGSAQGIGRAIAEVLAADGVDVAIVDINEEGSQATAKEIAEKYGVKTWAAKLDVSDSAMVQEVFKNCAEELGPINILVNNAGVTRDGLLMRMKDDQWSTVINIHLNGTMYCSRAVLKGMLKQRYGRIVNISSIVGVHGQAGQTNYAAAKAGIIGFSKALGQEVASRNITVNAVAPGYIQTAMTKALPEKVIEAMKEKIPMHREGTVDDISAAVRFLTSDGAAYITGAVLPIDGGLGM
jgi:3-oxoacyl-[acyl-carrier protein] reductase